MEEGGSPPPRIFGWRVEVPSDFKREKKDRPPDLAGWGGGARAAEGDTSGTTVRHVFGGAEVN